MAWAGTAALPAATPQSLLTLPAPLGPLPALTRRVALLALRDPHTVLALRSPHTVLALRGPHTVLALRGPHTVLALQGPHTVAVTVVCVCRWPPTFPGSVVS